MSPTPTMQPMPEPPAELVGAMIFGFFLFVFFLLCLPIVFHYVAYRYGCFEEWVKCVQHKTKECDTRARRKEYVGFLVANWLIAYDFGFLDVRFGTLLRGDLGVFWLLFMCATLVPHIAVTIRRLHDTGRSGHWIFLAIVPVVGYVSLVFILLFFDSQPGDNLYGPNPKGEFYGGTVLTAGYVPVAVAQQMSTASFTTDGRTDAPLLDQSQATMSRSEELRKDGNVESGDGSRSNLV